MILCRVLLLALLASLLRSALSAAPVVEEPALKLVFDDQGVVGSFVLYDPELEAYRVHNAERARTRFWPASTFKIANALIGIEVGAVRDLKEVLPYGGGDEHFDSWERDMNLREAMKASNVAVFHQLAKRIGVERMRDHVERFDYGNERVGNDIERRFWLTGPLAISPFEQADFLRRLASGELPVKESSVDSLKEIIEYETGEACAIYAKTGWGGPDHPQAGWWVGWVEKGDQSYPFAVNMDVANLEAAKLRVSIGLKCLAALGVVD